MAAAAGVRQCVWRGPRGCANVCGAGRGGAPMVPDLGGGRGLRGCANVCGPMARAWPGGAAGAGGDPFGPATRPSKPAQLPKSDRRHRVREVEHDSHARFPKPLARGQLWEVEHVFRGSTDPACPRARARVPRSGPPPFCPEVRALPSVPTFQRRAPTAAAVKPTTWGRYPATDPRPAHPRKPQWRRKPAVVRLTPRSYPAHRPGPRPRRAGRSSGWRRR